MVRSLAVVLGAVALVLLVTWRPQPDAVKVVDVAPFAALATEQAPFPILQIPLDGYQPTSARWQPTLESDEAPVWFVGYVTPSGEYLHAAPWNLYNLGVASTSHGCTNMSMEDAIWFYENAFEGDPVITKGTGVDLDWYEGPGAMWNIDWAGWTDRSFSLA